MKIKSLISAAFLSACTIFHLTALPGVDSLIHDQSGQYVYYKDSSFKRESYFGIIYYDDNTYGIRYFAPAVTDTTPLLPKKDISILFTLDGTKDYVELTGERIISTITPEDTDLVNYLHDMIYELTAHRQKAGLISELTEITQEYDQFGGNVKITYDPLVPVFNIKKISDPKGTSVFSLVTAGMLSSNKDDNFAAFEGLPVKIQDEHSLKLNKKAKKEKISYEKVSGVVQTINLDDQWTANAENLYLMGNTAMLAFDVIDLSTISSKTEKDSTINSILRNFSFGSNGTYPYCELTSVESKKNSTTVTNIFYNDVSKSFTKNIKILTKINENMYGLMTISVFQGAYSRNNKYFDAIIKSYKIN